MLVERVGEGQGIVMVGLDDGPFIVGPHAERRVQRRRLRRDDLAEERSIGRVEGVADSEWLG